MEAWARIEQARTEMDGPSIEVEESNRLLMKLQALVIRQLFDKQLDKKEQKRVEGILTYYVSDMLLVMHGDLVVRENSVPLLKDMVERREEELES